MADEENGPMTDEDLALARRGEKMIAAAVAEVEAPQSVREAIERTRTGAPPRSPWWRRYRWAVAAAGVAAAAVLAVVAIDSEDAAAPSLEGVYAAAEQAPSQAPPARLGGDPPVLDASVGAIEFPDWKRAFGWTAVGRRETELAGRDVTTVSYRNAEGARLGYAVVDGEPLTELAPGDALRRKGDTYRVHEGGGRTTVTWTQQGHTCAIVAPATVPKRTLLELAASRNPAGLPA